MFSQLFRGVAPLVGTWPQSRAYYAVDVVIDDSDRKAPQPKLCEVNFMGNFGALRVAAEQAGRIDLYHEWANDLMLALATDTDLSENPRLVEI